MLNFKTLTVVFICLAAISCTYPPDKQNPLTKSSTELPDSTVRYEVRFRDQQQIEKVIYGFAENFDNVKLDKCLEYMDDSISGEIDGIVLRGKTDFSARIIDLAESVKDAHFQQRHLLSNMQFEPTTSDTVKVSMYCANLWTDLKSGAIELLSVGYYKGKMVKKNDKWLIATLNSLPDSRLVKKFYNLPLDSVNKKRPL
ncbi:nuclear transport factor 2 family protein [Chitinophaga sp. Hz27]|uniref:nuclear transport factor 2 family protein n=1 Tax=Chitinophaga sp. Hz27 TaxID=3347169 RepID=UPI0035D818D5